MTGLTYPTGVFIIAFFPGSRFERSLVQTATTLRGDVASITDHPIAVVLRAMPAYSRFEQCIAKGGLNTTWSENSLPPYSAVRLNRPLCRLQSSTIQR